MCINDTKIDGRKAPYKTLIHFNHSGREVVSLIEYQPGKYRFFAFVVSRLMDATLEDIPLKIIEAVEEVNPSLIVHYSL
jgi:hypothetical protein